MTAVEGLLILTCTSSTVGLVIGLLVQRWARKRLREAPDRVSEIHSIVAIVPVLWLALFALLFALDRWGPASLEALEMVQLGILWVLGIALPCVAALVPVHVVLAGMLWDRNRGRERPLSAVFLFGVAGIAAVIGFLLR